jgi:hypothetical protein
MRELDETVARIIKGSISIREAVEPPQGVPEKPHYEDANDFFDSAVAVMGGHVIHQSDKEPIAIGQYHDSRFIIRGAFGGRFNQVQISLAKGSPYVLENGENFATGGLVELTLYGAKHAESEEVEPTDYSYSLRHGNGLGRWELYLGSPRHRWQGMKHAIEEAHSKLHLLNEASPQQLAGIGYDKLQKKWQFQKHEELDETTHLARALIAAVKEFVENPLAHSATRGDRGTPPEPHEGETFLAVVLDPFRMHEIEMDIEPEAVKGHAPLFTGSVRIGVDPATRHSVVVTRGGRLFTLSVYEVDQDVYLKMNAGNIDWWFAEQP